MFELSSAVQAEELSHRGHGAVSCICWESKLRQVIEANGAGEAEAAGIVGGNALEGPPPAHRAAAGRTARPGSACLCPLCQASVQGTTSAASRGCPAAYACRPLHVADLGKRTRLLPHLAF